MSTFTFAELLRGFLSRASLNQGELAQALRVHRNTVGAWVRGDNVPDTREMVLRIAEELHLAAAETDQLLRAAQFPTEHDTADPYRTLHQLRAPVGDFVGRAEEITALTAALSSGAAAAISGVAGMGGIGKTELAMVVGNQLVERYPDAQIVLNLQGSREPALPAAQALQQVLRAFLPDAQLPDDEASLVAAYRSVLTGKRALILADDARDAAQVELLIPPVGSALLVTTRYRFTLPGMLTRDLEELPEVDAIRLLQTINPQIHHSDAVEIARLCGRLPLALRVVAGLTRKTSRSIVAYVDLLRDERKRLERLVDVKARLNVEATLSLSYALLDPGDQHTLAQLGVMAASFTQEAAAVVLALQDPDQVIDQLDRLIEASLLAYDPAQGRYDLHELVRVFALARLREQDDVERAARLRHARYYIAVARQAEDQFLAGGEGITAGLALFDRERANLDAARRWLQSLAEDDDADELLIADADATTHIGDLRYGKRLERIPQLEAALAAAGRLGQPTAQGAALGALGIAHAALGDARRAIAFFQQQLTIAREIGDRLGEGNALGNLGNAYAALGDAHRAIDCYQQHLAVSREMGDRRGEGNTLCNLGTAYTALGEARRAIDWYQQALVVARELGDRRGEGSILCNLGTAYAELGEVHRAIDFFQQQLTIARELGDRYGEGTALGNLGLVYADLGEAGRAIDWYQQALVVARELGDRRGEGNALGNLGNAYTALGKARRAIEFHQQALLVSREIGDRRAEGQDLGNLGTAYAALGESRNAIDCYQQALLVVREIGDRQSEEEIGWNVGFLLAREGDVDQALPYLETSLAFHQAIDHPRAAGMAAIVGSARQHDRLPEQLSVTPALPDDIPEHVRQALEARDQAALQATLEALPEAERTAVIAQLQEAGILGRGPDMAAVLRQFEPLLRGIAAVATGDAGPRAEVEAALPRLEVGGWRLTSAVQRIWAGERDTAALTTGIDANSAMLVRRVLELITAPATDAAPGSDPAGTGEPLPASIQAAIASGDQTALQAALAELSPEARARVEALLREASEQAIARARRHRPEEIVAGLPAAVRAALEQGDQAALSAALTGLAGDAQQRALADLADLQTLTLLAAQEAQQRDPRERFAALLRDIARVTVGDSGPREGVVQALTQMEQAGWMLRGPVERIWQGERARDALVAGLDEQDTLLIERVLELVGVYERGEQRLPSQVLAELPEPLRLAIEQQDEAVFNAALEALGDDERARAEQLLAELQSEAPPAEGERDGQEQPGPASGDDERAALINSLPEAVRAALRQGDVPALQAALDALPEDEARAMIEGLQQAGIIGTTPQPDRPRPDIDQVIQDFLPLLGDIALAAFGDSTARQLAEAVLPQLEEDGWRLEQAARRLWAGERDPAALTTGIDPNSAALVRRILRLVADGPGMIGAAGSIQIARLGRQADGVAAQALASGDAQQRAELARQLEEVAGQAEQQLGAPWQELAAHLRALAAQLRGT